MFRDQSGNTSIEYALIAFLLGLLIIGCFACTGFSLIVESDPNVIPDLNSFDRNNRSFLARQNFGGLFGGIGGYAGGTGEPYCENAENYREDGDDERRSGSDVIPIFVNEIMKADYDKRYKGGLAFIGVVLGLLGFAALYWQLLNGRWR